MVDSSVVDHPVTHAEHVAKTRRVSVRPPVYRVVLHNDDYTPMDFVVHVLCHFFGMDQERAIQVMWEVHHQGQGICGIYTYEIAETKVYQVHAYARDNGHPLLSHMEPV